MASLECPVHLFKIKRQKIVGEKGSIDMEFIRSRRRLIVDGIDVLTEIVKQAMNSRIVTGKQIGRAHV